MKRSRLKRKQGLRRTSIRRISPAKATWQARYRRALSKRKQEHPNCEVCEHEGRGWVPADDGHHPFGRRGQRIMVFIVASRQMHDWIHGNPNEARRIGWLYDERHPERLNQTCRDAAIRGGMFKLLKGYEEP